MDLKLNVAASVRQENQITPRTPRTPRDGAQVVMSLPPKIVWLNYDSTKNFAKELDSLGLLGEGATEANKSACLADPKAMIDACMVVLSLTEDPPLIFILTAFYNMLREDSSCYKIFDEAIRMGTDMATPMMKLLSRPNLDSYIADKTLWLLSSIMAHQPRSFDIAKVSEFVCLAERSDTCSELGRLEALVNLLKCESYREPIWMSHPGVVVSTLTKLNPDAPSQMVYKSLFAVWMLSFSPEILPSLSEVDVINRIKDILLECRVEKVIRLSLTVVKNLMTSKTSCEAIVKEGLLEAVQQLEYEKWRDAELYDDINSVASAISCEVKDLSSFERYQEELESEALTWGYLHTSKFFAENIMKFERDGFHAVHVLAKCLDSSDPITLAVACHDIGEFTSLHPLGKKVLAGIPSVKEKVMSLMASTSPELKEVRREALLCCQKIMLNKWQDIAADKK